MEIQWREVRVFRGALDRPSTSYPAIRKHLVQLIANVAGIVSRRAVLHHQKLREVKHLGQKRHEVLLQHVEISLLVDVWLEEVGTNQPTTNDSCPHHCAYPIHALLEDEVLWLDETSMHRVVAVHVTVESKNGLIRPDDVHGVVDIDPALGKHLLWVFIPSIGVAITQLLNDSRMPNFDLILLQVAAKLFRAEAKRLYWAWCQALIQIGGLMRSLNCHWSSAPWNIKNRSCPFPLDHELAHALRQNVLRRQSRSIVHARNSGIIWFPKVVFHKGNFFWCWTHLFYV